MFIDLHQSIILAYTERRLPCNQSNVSQRPFGYKLIQDSFTLDYSKLPPSPPIDHVFLLDPLIATGGTACAALAMIDDWGIPGGS